MLSKKVHVLVFYPLLRSALFWNYTQCRLVVCYRHFGATCRSHLQESVLPRNVGSTLTKLGCVKSRNSADLSKDVAVVWITRLRQVKELIPTDIWITSYNDMYKRNFKIKRNMQQRNDIKIWNKIKNVTNIPVQQW